LYINAHINTAEGFENIYLESITISTSERVLEATDISCTPPQDYIYQKDFANDEGQYTKKTLSLVLCAKDFIKYWETDALAMKFTQADMSRTLFFVYIKCTGTVTNECIPCRLDEATTIGVTFDVNLLYQRVMDYTKSLLTDCTVPREFTDFILLWNAFKAAIETEHYVPAIKFWNMLFGIPSKDERVDGSHSIFGGGGSHLISKSCGCHG
jgi:hypothetical protein